MKISILPQSVFAGALPQKYSSHLVYKNSEFPATGPLDRIFSLAGDKQLG